jgi:hypothetical protein
MGADAHTLLDPDLRRFLRPHSLAAGNVIGPLIGYEVLTAFFLESTIRGILLSGWGRVPPSWWPAQRYDRMGIQISMSPAPVRGSKSSP